MLVIFKALIDFFVGLIGEIVQFIVSPLFDYFVNIGVLDNNWLTTTTNFLNDVYNSIEFATRVVLNVTGIPQPIFAFLMIILTAMFGLFIGTLSLRFIINAWVLFRGGKAFIDYTGGK